MARSPGTHALVSPSAESFLFLVSQEAPLLRAPQEMEGCFFKGLAKAEACAGLMVWIWPVFGLSGVQCVTRFYARKQMNPGPSSIVNCVSVSSGQLQGLNATNV